jgi:hypothetical protein
MDVVCAPQEQQPGEVAKQEEGEKDTEEADSADKAGSDAAGSGADSDDSKESDADDEDEAKPTEEEVSCASHSLTLMTYSMIRKGHGRVDLVNVHIKVCRNCALQKKEDPAYVPKGGKYFMHDDRRGGGGRGRGRGYALNFFIN